VGLCAVVGILVMRVLTKKYYNRFITFFVSVGVGSLSGSAMFHLLPQACLNKFWDCEISFSFEFSLPPLFSYLTPSNLR